MSRLHTSEKTIVTKVASRLLRRRLGRDVETTNERLELMTDAEYEVHVNYPYAVVILRKRINHKNIIGTGFAKYNPNDIGNHEWDENLGKSIALGKAVRDFEEKIHAAITAEEPLEATAG